MQNVYILIALFVLLMVINSVIKNFLRRKYNILIPRRLFSYVNNTHRVIEIMLIILGIILFILFMIKEDLIFFYLLMAFTVVLTILRAFIEYKYKREEREYMITLADAGTWTAIFIIVLLVNFN